MLKQLNLMKELKLMYRIYYYIWYILAYSHTQRAVRRQWNEYPQNFPRFSAHGRAYCLRYVIYYSTHFAQSHAVNFRANCIVVVTSQTGAGAKSKCESHRNDDGQNMRRKTREWWHGYSLVVLLEFNLIYVMRPCAVSRWQRSLLGSSSCARSNIHVRPSGWEANSRLGRRVFLNWLQVFVHARNETAGKTAGWLFWWKINTLRLRRAFSQHNKDK